MNILDFIKNFKEKNGENFFLNGGCYIFSRILQVNYGGIVYSNGQHCIVRIGDFFYDIEGVRSKETAIDNRYIIIDKSEEKRYEKYQTFMI